MEHAQGYVLGESARAARRLEIQDAHFAEVSERLLDELALRPNDRVVELGCGAGSFTRRVVQRLGTQGVVVGVDCTAGLLAQATTTLERLGPGRFEPIQGDINDLGQWLTNADVVVARTVLHHLPMAEFFLGRLRAKLRPGTRVGFLEPDFRTPLARIAYLEATGRPELAALRIWATVINELYLAIRISPSVGATLAKTLEFAGYQKVRATWSETSTSSLTLENMLMFYDEVRGRLQELGILSATQIDEQQRLLRSLSADDLPPAWGIFRVVAEA